jgi:predicted Zn-dependent protease
MLLSALLSAALHTAPLLAAAPPTSAELVQLGEGLALRGDGKKAQGHLEKALADPALATADKARAHKARGRALLQQKKIKDAVPQLEQATTLAPRDEKAWLYLGLARDQAGDAAGAIAAYADGAKANPKSTALAHEHGMALLSAGKVQQAADVLEKAAARAEQDPELQSDAAYALTLVGKFKEAREVANRGTELAPESPDPFYVLGRAELGLGNRAAACRALEQAVDNDNTHVASLYELGVLAQLDKKDAEAEKRFLRVLQLEPGHARAKLGLATQLTRAGKDDKRAEALLLEITQVDPSSALSFALLADVQWRLGKKDEAKKALAAALKLKADPAWQKTLDSWKKQK